MERVCQYVREIAPDIDAFVLPDERQSYLKASQLKRYLRPTLAVSLREPKRFRPKLRALCHGSVMRKSEEYAALERLGIPVPRWILLHEGEELDPEGFGPYVVSKPDMGLAGAKVRIRRTSRFRWGASDRDQLVRFRKGVHDLVIQDFIYTGPWPVSYRVTTLFGKVLFSLRAEADHRRKPLKDRWAFSEGGVSIVSTAVGSRYELEDDPEIIRFGERAHAAFPDVPLLGVDIIRDCQTGELYLLEVNGGGQVWHFSSEMGLGVQETWGLDLESQFDGFRRAAEVLVEQTRRRAR
jgi:hypothetical protein